MLAILAFLATIPAANWMIGHVGVVCAPVCLVPVGFGLMAPSGVLMIGVALVLRDYVQERIGPVGVLVAIIGGAAVSLLVSPIAVALASAAAFAISELADFAVYTPLRRRNLSAAVLASGIVGAAVDSILFLSLAFGSLEFLSGQIVGKLWMSAAAALGLAVLGRRRAMA